MDAATVELRTADGVRLAATAWPRDAAPAAVVVAHGLGVHRGNASVLALANRLAAAGFAVLSYDGRGHGASTGICTLGTDERLDVAAAVGWARQRSAVVVAIGASMGGIAVLRHAAEHDDVDGVVAVSVPATWRIHSPRSFVAAALTRTSAGRRLMHRRTGTRLAATWSSPPPPAELAALIRQPVAVVHGAEDRFIPPREARLLFDRLAEPRRLDIVDRMGHGYGTVAAGAIFDAVTWLLGLDPTTTPDRPAPGRCAQPSPD